MEKYCEGVIHHMCKHFKLVGGCEDCKILIFEDKNIMEDKKELEAILAEIDVKAKTKGAVIDARFGDDWKETIGNKTPCVDLIEISWVQGRRAILLERALEDILTD